jgi:hypothetical protein
MLQKIIIKNKIKSMKNSIKSDINVKYSFTFAFLLSYFDLNIPNES